MNNPKVSIITAVKNDKAGLERTLNSIRLQNYPDLEFIVVDGGSSDGTLDLIQKNSDTISKYISEPDKGISDAFNKGLKLATGEFINFQGAGDTLYSSECLRDLFAKAKKETILVCGRVMRVSTSGQPLWAAPKNIPKQFNKHSLLFKLSLPHQALFTHRQFFERWGQFDLNARFAMDYDLMLRAYHDFPKTQVIDVMVSNWQAGGIGTNQILSVLAEYHKLKIKYKVANQIFLSAIHHLNQLKYFTKKILMMDY